MIASLLPSTGARRAELKPDVIEAFEQRRQHAWNKLHWSVPEHLKSGSMLDIGCGTGNGIVAALQLGFKSATGIDRDLNDFATCANGRGCRTGRCRGTLNSTRLPMTRSDIAF